MEGTPLTGLNGPFFEQGNVFAVYEDQNRYWINVNTWTVMEAPNNSVSDDDFKVIEGSLAELLKTFVRLQFSKDPSLAERKCRTLTIVTTDTGNYVASDSLLRVMSDLPERIQAAKGKGDGRTFATDLRNIDFVEIKGEIETYTCSRDFFDFVPNLTELILESEKKAN